jgi:F-type H+-transporting ATPase subunit c
MIDSTIITLIMKGLVFFAMAPAVWAIGHIGGKAMEAIGRNPEASEAISKSMLIAMAFAEVVTIFCFLAYFTLK